MKPSRLLNSKIVLMTILVLLISMSLFLTQLTFRKNQVKQQSEILKKEIEKLEAKKSQLSKLIEYFKTPEYAEKEARRMLGFKKPDEEVVVVFPKKEKFIQEEKSRPSKESSKDSRASSEGLLLWQWWEYFFGANSF